VRSLPGEFRVVGICCNLRWQRLAAQAAEFGASAAAVKDPDAAARFEAACPPGTRLYRGDDGVLGMIEELRADIVVNGISGASGLLPSLRALCVGSDLALANKESMVMAGRLILAEAAARGRRLLPVDSEHAALFSLLGSQDYAEVAELILTASGGAFRDLPRAELERVRFADALNHPTWKMGAKITVDSASMANKGLEVIEAHRLFGVPIEKIRVLIHPQSMVHSLVRTVDGTLHAQLSTPDMKIPIQNALTYPAVRPVAVDWLELAGKQLTFLPVDGGRYPMLGLAYEAAVRSVAHPVVFNAANEVAVDGFMKNAVRFSALPGIVAEALSMDWSGSCDTVEGVLDVDREARLRTAARMKGLT
jgi:1-deoxy-D-xylulose-5-phosphate reductoisomerase